MNAHRLALPCLGLALLLGACSSGSTDVVIPPPDTTKTHPQGVISAALALGGRPHGVAVAANGTFYISRIDADSVTRGHVDSIGQAFTGSAPVGSTPAHVALTPDGQRAFTANQFGNTVSVVAVPGNVHMAEIPLSDGGFNLLVSPDGGRLYATTAAGVLHVIALSTLTVTDTINVGSAANGLAIDATTQRVYVSSIFANQVTALNPVTNAVLRTYPVAGGPQRIALHDTGDELYIASQSVGLEVLDLATGAHTAVTGVGAGAVGLALSPDQAQLYVTRPPDGQVIVVDRATRTVVKVLDSLLSPRNVAFTADGRVALVTGEGGVVYFIR